MADEQLHFNPSEQFTFTPSEPITIRPNEVAVIHILPPNGEQGALLSIHGDGRITFGPAFTTTDEASLLFWKTLADSLPVFKQMLMAHE